MKRVLYIRAVVECEPDFDPMLELSDAALWAECRLSHQGIYTTVTVYKSAEDIVLDEKEGIFNKEKI